MKTVEELLYPRYKVINPWPDMGRDGYHQGKIITLELHDGNQWYERQRDLTIYEAFYQGYPHLFQPLPWSDREISDMPAYVRCVNGWIHKVIEHKETGCEAENNWWLPYSNITPASHADYEQYNQQKEGMK